MRLAPDKYRARAKRSGSMLCVGLDPVKSRMPDKFAKMVIFPEYHFNKWIIDQTHESALAYKLNLGFYLPCLAAGLLILERTMRHIREEYPGILTICDAKFGDIANTNEHYAKFVFDKLGFDAVTLNPYVGLDALSPFLEREDKYSLILCGMTSEGPALHCEAWKFMVEDVANWEGNRMVVVPASASVEDMGVTRSIVGEDMPIFVPGLGAQGGKIARVARHLTNADGGRLIANLSRSILYNANPRVSAQEWKDQLTYFAH